MAFLRPVAPSADTPALDHVFRVTAGPAFKSEPAATIGSNMFCHPYPILAPDTCFVLDSGSGEAVGYILGTPDTTDFARRWRVDFTKTLDQRPPQGMRRPPDYDAEGIARPKAEEDFPAHLLDLLYNRPEDLLNLNVLMLGKRYAAHFHIDILPSHQRQGWGTKMIELMLDSLKAKGAKSVFLGMEAANESAGKFYDAMGFSVLLKVLDEGASGEKGETSGGNNETIFLVKDL